MTKKRALIIYRSYFPSLSHLGPATAIRNLVRNLNAYYDFHILTLNYEFSSGEPLFESPVHTEFMDGAVVEYIPRSIRGLSLLRKRLSEGFDVIDIHCAFDPILSIPSLILCRLGLAKESQTFHTPHGIFMDIIMSKGRWKKKMFCFIADILNVFGKVTHLAGSPGEAADIQRRHMRQQSVKVVSQFVEVPDDNPKRSKPINSLKIAFVGRITEQKNLLYAIDVLRAVKMPSTMDVFGDSADESYAARCMEAIQVGIGKCTIVFNGNVSKEELFKKLPSFDILLHPTLGENFGHSIVESLSCGVPVIISDQAPWTNVAAFNAGWCLPLSDPKAFSEKLDEIYSMGEEWSSLSRGAMTYAHQTFDPAETSRRYRLAYG